MFYTFGSADYDHRYKLLLRILMEYMAMCEAVRVCSPEGCHEGLDCR